MIEEKENITIIEQVIQANLKDNYYSKLCYLLKKSFQTKDINLYYFSYPLFNMENYMHRYSRL